MSNKNMEVISDEKRGLVEGYKPNRISLYILMLTAGRLQELMNVLYKDMEEYKLPDIDKDVHSFNNPPEKGKDER
tara:strand:+ start:1386 stop:1610 length:225 start_codon:yes stop_codon:yes gene_type:complete